jgi:hypothetical protein
MKFVSPVKALVQQQWTDSHMHRNTTKSDMDANRVNTSTMTTLRSDEQIVERGDGSYDSTSLFWIAYAFT